MKLGHILVIVALTLIVFFTFGGINWTWQLATNRTYETIETREKSSPSSSIDNEFHINKNATIPTSTKASRDNSASHNESISHLVESPRENDTTVPLNGKSRSNDLVTNETDKTNGNASTEKMASTRSKVINSSLTPRSDNTRFTMSEIRYREGRCEPGWTLTMSFTEHIVLKNHYTPFCVSQPGLHGSIEMVISSNKSRSILESLNVPFYKGKCCSLISGRFRSEKTVQLSFPGCPSHKTLTVTEVDCFSRTLEKQHIRASCVQGTRPPDFHADIVVLSTPVNVSHLLLGKLMNPVLFTQSSLEKWYSGNQPRLTLESSVISQSNTWFASENAMPTLGRSPHQ